MNDLNLLADAAVIVLLGGEALLGGMARRARAPWCRCGHGRRVHEHHRRGTDCSQCRCPRFRAPLARFRGGLA